MSATIKDIRKKTGLSLATISKYLNGGNVLPENREKIGGAIKELHYHVNDMARSLVTSQTRSVGMVVPSMVSPFHGSLIRYIESELKQAGYSLMVCDSMDDAEQERDNIEFLSRKNVDGLVLIPTGRKIQDILDLVPGRVPIITLDVKWSGISGVTIDNVRAGYEATSYLTERGHRRIGIIYIGKQCTGRQRLKGYCKALAKRGIQREEVLEMATDGTVDGAYEAMNRLLSLDRRPTAVFTCNHDMNIGAVMAMNDAGFRYPTDLSIIGFDDLLIPSILNPRLTVLEQPMEEMGNAAARIILEHMRHTDPADRKAEQHVYRAILHEGKSVERINPEEAEKNS